MAKEHQGENPTLEGGPVPAETPAPEFVEIKIDGKTYSVTPEVAEAMQARERSFNQRFSQQGQELGQLRQMVNTINQSNQRPQDPAPGPADDPDLPFFESPSRAIKQFGQTLRQELTQELRQQYQIEREREAWWGHFYRDNPQFVGKEAVVNAVLVQSFDAIKDLPGPQARQKLAESINELVGSFQQPGTRQPASSRPAVTERASGPRAPVASPAEPEGPTTLTEILMKRREQRRAARLGKTA